jgi:cytochrome c
MRRIETLAVATLGLFMPGYDASAEKADVAEGARVYRACMPCHSLQSNKNMTGSSLSEVWDRQAGSLASFHRYS